MGPVPRRLVGHETDRRTEETVRNLLLGKIGEPRLEEAPASQVRGNPCRETGKRGNTLDRADKVDAPRPRDTLLRVIRQVQTAYIWMVPRLQPPRQSHL
jgi:hypothetical protein